GETRWVTSLCFSADGSSVAAGRADKTISCWDWESERLRFTVKGHINLITAVATISCWDWESERLRFTVKGHINLITAVAFSPDGSCLASGSFGDVVLRDAASGTEQRRLSPFPGWATMLWFSKGGSYEFATRPSGKEQRRLSPFPGWTTMLWFSKDGGRVLASSEKAGSGDIDARVQEDTAHAESGRPEKVDAATVVCWDVATGELLTPLDKDLEDAVGQKQSRDAGPSGRLCIDRTTHHVVTPQPL
ncbi:WD40-repeat-containing domain protein, partial [Baffinella frigidus]